MLACQATGLADAPVVVLVHGIIDDHRSRLPLAERLSDSRRCLLLDLPGHGASPRLPAYGLGAITDAVAATLRLHLQAPAVIVGHSLGGLVALAMAARHPELTRAVLAEDPPLFALHEGIASRPRLAEGFAGNFALRQAAGSAAELARIWRAERPDWDEATATQRAERLWATDPAMLATLLNDGFAADLAIEASYAAIRCPLRIVAGELDYGSVTDDAALARLDHLPDYHWRRVPGAGHSPMAKDFDGIVAQILSLGP